MTEIKKSFFHNMKQNRLLAFAKVFGYDRVTEELCKAGIKKFDLTPANVDPSQKPEFENKEVFNGTKYENAAPGDRQVVTETSQDIANGGNTDSSRKGEESDGNIEVDEEAQDPADENEGVDPEEAKGVKGTKTPVKPGAAKKKVDEKVVPAKKPKKPVDEEEDAGIAKSWDKMMAITKAYAEKRIVIGALYIPYDPADESTIDSHGHACLREDIENAAYEFMRKMNLYNVDMQHNFIADYGYVVESYIAKAGDPLFKEGTWVVGVKVTDDSVWSMIESGEITGFSLAGHAHLKAPEEVL